MNPHELGHVMTARCVLAHPHHPLTLLIVERGLLEGLSFFAQPRDLKRLRHRFSSELIVYPDAFQALDSLNGGARFLLIGGEKVEVDVPEGSPCVVLWTTESDTLHRPGDTNVVLHNMLPPLANSSEDRMFATWRNHCIEGDAPELNVQTHHWCDRKDVTSAVVLMLKQDVAPGRYDLAGRRSWTMSETWNEFSHLMKRTQAGQTGMFGREHLNLHGVPSVGVVPIAEAMQGSERPNLDAVHDFLAASTGEGWRPKTPLRHSLMFVIEELERRQTS